MQRPDLSLFPDSPGVYLFKDASGRIIYVGKALRLRRRVASYFREESALTAKTAAMVRRAESLDFFSTGTEKEALLLEAGLIKKHRPRYNILLRDDKDHLLFRISSRHPYPRVEIVRRVSATRRAGDEIFGPFSSGGAARETWRLIHKYFPLRRCRDAAFANRTRPCLYYDIGQCSAPCVLPVPEEEYRATLRQVELLLSGRSRELLDKLRTEMLAASEALAFESAARLRDQIRAVERTLERQSVVLAKEEDLDLIGVGQAPEGLALGLAVVRRGALQDQRAFFFPGLSPEDLPDLLEGFLSQFYLQGSASPPPRIVVPWLPEAEPGGPPPFEALEQALSDLRGAPAIIRVPRGPDEDKLALMAAGHALDTAKRRLAPAVGELLASRLRLAAPVRRIEAVDISHTGGRQTRAGMVVFEDGEPRPEEHRAYAVETETPGDDYAALAAWAERRIASGPPWPDLIVIDGGKGQLAAVERVFREQWREQRHEPGSGHGSEPGLENSPLLVGLAKARDEEGRADRRAGNVEDRLFLPGRSNPVPLRPGSPELLFLQRVRDAVHNYTLGKHRRARTKAALAGELTRLPGIGPELARRLFERFGSLKALAAAPVEELRRVPGVGKNRAAQLRERLRALVETETARE